MADLPEGRFDLVVTSPGWKPERPVLAAAIAAGIPVIGEVELAWRIRGTNDAKWLAITGTNGKTTTTTMLESIFARRRDARPGLRQHRHAAARSRPRTRTRGARDRTLELPAPLGVLDVGDLRRRPQPRPPTTSTGTAPRRTPPTRRRSTTTCPPRASTTSPTRRPCAWSRTPTSSPGPGRSASPRRSPAPVSSASSTSSSSTGPSSRGYTAAAELASLSDVAQAAGTPGRRPADHQIANALAAAALPAASTCPVRRSRRGRAITPRAPTGWSPSRRPTG